MLNIFPKPLKQMKDSTFLGKKENFYSLDFFKLTSEQMSDKQHYFSQYLVCSF